jgi:hypothetical protein
MCEDQSDEAITASTVMVVRYATGLGVVDTKQLLVSSSPLFRSRLLLAIAR